MSSDASIASVDPPLPPDSSASYVAAALGNSASPPESDHPLLAQCKLIYQSLRKSAPPSASPPHVVGVTSCYDGEGVTTVASQLAMAAAAEGRRALLVDANFTSPSLHRLEDGSPSPGLTDALADDRPFDEIIRQVPDRGVALVTAGGPPSATNGHVPARMQAFVRYVEEHYAFAVFDLPPLCRPADTVALCELLHGVLLVIQSERVRWPVAKRFVADLQRSGATTLGAVMNRRRQHIPGWLYRTL